MPILPHQVEGHNRVAMQMAIDRLIAKGGARRQQIENMLKDDPWEMVGFFAAYSCQIESLKLHPWQEPPCCVNDPDDPEPGMEASAKLRGEMRDAGVSRWHPDPKAEIAKARRRARSKSLVIPI